MTAKREAALAEPPISEQIRKLKKRYGSDLFILGHYYQNQAILQHADIIGDSYKLSVEASRNTARNIVFCGVHFMAESASILCQEGQRVFIPDRDAGCPMADMITPGQFEASFRQIENMAGKAPTPLLYVNSSAVLKAMTGERAGVCCTSSNAELIARSLLAEGDIIYFLPDRNLGWNVGAQLGLHDGEMQLVSDALPPESGKRLYLWDGFCPIHQRFALTDVGNARRRFPGCRILVHPEAPPEVVKAVDGTGSTSQLYRSFEEASAGSILVIGTEIEFVSRLATLRDDVTVVPLAVSRCRNMAKITEKKLLSTLRSMEDPDPPGEVAVGPETAEAAGLALRRMIERVEGSR
jgi:quinolinate synthase